MQPESAGSAAPKSGGGGGAAAAPAAAKLPIQFVKRLQSEIKNAVKQEKDAS